MEISTHNHSQQWNNSQLMFIPKNYLIFTSNFNCKKHLNNCNFFWIAKNYLLFRISSRLEVSPNSTEDVTGNLRIANDFDLNCWKSDSWLQRLACEDTQATLSDKHRIEPSSLQHRKTYKGKNYNFYTIKMNLNAHTKKYKVTLSGKWIW